MADSIGRSFGILPVVVLLLGAAPAEVITHTRPDAGPRAPRVEFAALAAVSIFSTGRLRGYLAGTIRRFLNHPGSSADVTASTTTVSADLRSIRNSTAPVIVGPWLSEVGFELLYWIPFLQWVAIEHGIDRTRAIAVSRGGTSAWYGQVAARYVDIFDYVPADEYRSRVDERVTQAGHQKQYEASEFDEALLDSIKDRLNVRDAHVLHPAAMYGLFRRYWYEKAPVGILTKHTRYLPLSDPGDVDATLALPKEFVAVRFYFRSSFPDTPENRRFAADVIRRLARRGPVVMLNPGFQVDDHVDFELSTTPGVHRVDEWMTPARNLHLQSQIIRRATALVGTYGGLSYLGPYYRVPTMTFYSVPDELVPAHLDATWRLCRTMRSSLTMVNVSDTPLIMSTLDGIGGRPAGREA